MVINTFSFAFFLILSFFDVNIVKVFTLSVDFMGSCICRFSEYFTYPGLVAYENTLYVDFG